MRCRSLSLDEVERVGINVAECEHKRGVRPIEEFVHVDSRTSHRFVFDGYIDNPHEWSSEYSTTEMQEYLTAMHLGADSLLLGRVTCEGMAQAWPNMGGNPLADHINAITKYVVASDPVDTAAWDPTVLIAGGDLVDEISQLKQGDGGDIIIWGTGQLTDALTKAGLFDEYRICTSLVIKGNGEPLFRQPAPAPSNSSTTTPSPAAPLSTSTTPPQPAELADLNRLENCIQDSWI